MKNFEINSIGKGLAELGEDLAELRCQIYDYLSKMKQDIINLQYQISALKNKVIPLDVGNNKVVLRIGDNLINIEMIKKEELDYDE